ncbi:MAG: hypothetical protein EOO38_14180 [Cytophagaceae bacterium]|nr:MAG: hypothetical protein EOO38_14180 [Cytophagaceae bacterium]
MRLFLFFLLLLHSSTTYSWGFYAHMRINYFAVFLLPPEMLVFYKPNISYLEEHAVDPDKRRYAIPQEGPRHYIDVDHYGQYPYDSLPRKWNAAVAKYSADTLQAPQLNSIVPPTMTVDQWREQGINPISWLPPTTRVIAFQFEGANGAEYWFGLQNFYTITRYNRSPMYAMAVYQLSQAIKLDMGKN